MKDAIKITREGVIIDLEISAGAKETAIQGYNAWRKRIEVRISQRAQKGKANGELISFLSNLFDVNSKNIEIISGLTSSKKSVLISQKKPDEILDILSKK
ncbi:MAG TPA: DUF167 domain-containing protein [Candidatus Methanoperedens sp.]|nr:DUF167 domain-containing protein [Candidatus Methanoperedens sp.]